MSLHPFLHKQPPNPKPTGQLASPRYNPVIKNLENSFKLPPKNPPIRIKFPPLPRIPAGRIGGGIASFLLNEFLFPETVADGTIPANLRPPESSKEIQSPTYPFRGGQGTGGYTIYIDYYRTRPFDDSSTNRRVYGPIGGFRLVDKPTTHEPTIQVFCFGEFGFPRLANQTWIHVFNNSWLRDFKVTKIVADLPDTAPGIDPPPTTPPIYSPPGIYIGGPTYIIYGSPPPPAPLPLAPPQPITRTPSPLPDGTTNPTPVPQPTPIGQPTPTPTGIPEPPITPNPTTGPTPTPTNVPPAILRGPWANPTPTPTSKPGYNPGFTPKFTPNPIQPHPGFSPNPIQVKPAPPISPLPTTGEPITTNNPSRTPTPVPPTTPTPPTPETPTKEPIEQLMDDLKPLIDKAPFLTFIPAIANNTSPDALRNAAEAGACRTTQPGGCTSNLINNAVGNINQNTNGRIDGLNTANGLANAEQLRLLNVLDNKLGAQIPNLGIGGKLTNFVNWSVVDRAINLVSLMASLHNVFMLSNAVKETFFDVLDNLLGAGFNIAPKIFGTSDGSAIDAREYFGNATDSFFSGLFGKTEWVAIKAQWKAYNTIYQSATNIYENLRQIHSETQELCNQARNYVSELGNALQDEGMISEDNWNYKDPNKRVKSKSFAKLERIASGLETLQNTLEALEQVTSSVREITDTANEIKENFEAIDKAISDANKAAKTDRDTKEEGLELPNFSLEDLF